LENSAFDSLSSDYSPAPRLRHASDFSSGLQTPQPTDNEPTFGDTIDESRGKQGKDADQSIVSLPQNQTSGPILSWLAADGREWRIELQPSLIRATSDGEVVALPADRWRHDIYVAPHGDGFIVRFETFERSVGFVIDGPAAAPLLGHIAQALPAARAEPPATPSPTPGEPLLWPKVSPLAVWALICSSLAFLPFVGVLPAAVTATLLLLHRKRVRKAAAWAHSRALCAAAFLFLSLGLVVCGLSSYGLYRSMSLAPPRGEWPHLRSPTGSAQPDSCGPQYSEPALPGLAATSPRPETNSVLASLDLEEQNWPLIALSLLVLLFALTVHEAAHAISAWWLGDDFARRCGRVTLNPLAHIDPFGTVLLPMILFLAKAPVFGWARPVPVRLDYVPRPRRAGILIAIAGPASNLLIASASISLLLGIACALRILAPGAEIPNLTGGGLDELVRVTGLRTGSVLGLFLTVLKLSFALNIFLAFFNLIPVPPLDGSWVLQHLFHRVVGPIYAAIRPYSFLLFLGLLYSGVLTYLLFPAVISVAFGFILLKECIAF
jgi:Zn-dependent protease